MKRRRAHPAVLPVPIQRNKRLPSFRMENEAAHHLCIRVEEAFPSDFPLVQNVRPPRIRRPRQLSVPSSLKRLSRRTTKPFFSISLRVVMKTLVCMHSDREPEHLRSDKRPEFYRLRHLGLAQRASD